MANDAVTIVGNLTADPLFNDKGRTPRASFRVAVNKKFNEEERTDFVPVTAFGTLAENVAASLTKGTRVVVQGRFNSYDKPVTIDGEEREISMLTVTADAIGPDLRWATAKVEKVVTGNARSARSADEVDEEEDEAPKPARKSRARATSGASRSSSSRGRKAPVEDVDDDLF